jgi:hypothetical protein
MSLFTKIVETVSSWRRRRAGTKSRKRADLAMEQLDHRQLLAVNFTGNVLTDFPATTSPGVVVLSGNANIPGYKNYTPQFPTQTPQGQQLANQIKVSGFEIDALRVNYDPSTDTLNVGLQGPDNQKGTGQEVIAGDSDNNGNSATVDPNVTAIAPAFADPADMGQSKSMGIFLDLNNPTTNYPAFPDIVAGFPAASQTSTAQKPYEVAKADTTGTPTSPTSPVAPLFDQANTLPAYTGNFYLANDPNHPNFELQIAHFSQLYLQTTGHALTSTSQIGIGAFGYSNQDSGISDEYFPAQTVTISSATTPVTPPPTPTPTVCSPTVYVNPHANDHVNTAHNDAIRVTVLGSSGFDPTTIIPSSVRFGYAPDLGINGATPVLNFENNVNHDQFPDETFVFNGLSVTLPPGVTTATISGMTTSGQEFASSVKVFNRDYSYYSQAAINKQQASFAAYDAKHGISTANGVVPPPLAIPKAALARAASGAVPDLVNPFAGEKAPVQVNPSAAALATATPASTNTPTTNTVKIKTKKGKVQASSLTVSDASTPTTISLPTASSSSSTASAVPAGPGIFGSISGAN